MAVKTHGALNTQFATDLADNTSGDIDASHVRGAFVDVTDTLFTANLNAQTGTSYTLALTDQARAVTMDNADANTVTIPTNAAVAFPTGTVIHVTQIGAGETSIAGATGVTLNGVSAGSGAIRNRWQGVSLLKLGTNTWVASGDIGAVA